MGAALLLSGLIAAIITAPLFDRVFTHHLALTSKFIVPMIAGAWLSLIWAVKPHNSGGLFAIMAIIGACSLVMLPIGLELGCELTRNPDGSSAILWFWYVALCTFFLLILSTDRVSYAIDVDDQRKFTWNHIRSCSRSPPCTIDGVPAAQHAQGTYFQWGFHCGLQFSGILHPGQAGPEGNGYQDGKERGNRYLGFLFFSLV